MGGRAPATRLSFRIVTEISGVESEAEARRLIEEDPYWTGGIWTGYELHEWIQAF
ncbi:MAG: hypothetical protein RX318_09490 [bacterium]|nr:hypothetical protein [bacterium]